MPVYLIISFCIFNFGSLGMFLSSKHAIIMLISLELILVAVNINFTVFSVFLDNILGQLYSLLLLVMAASESAMALAVIMLFYSLSGGVHVSLLNLLKG